MARAVILLFLCGAAFAKDLVLLDLLERGLAESDLELRANSKGKLTSAERTAVLDAHNEARANVQPSAANMVALIWDDELRKVAQKYANKCKWGHNSDRSSQAASYSYVGENLYVSSGSLNPLKAVENWVSEKNSYDFNKGSCSSVCGHYTQVVWASTTHVGCASKKCSSIEGLSGWKDATIMVCNYGKGGNYIGQKPYVSGSTCSQCPSGTSCQDGICAVGSGSSSSGSNSSGSGNSGSNSSGSGSGSSKCKK